MKLGIAGYGVIGSALGRWLEGHTSHEILIYDPAKGHSGMLSLADVIFVCVPVPSTPGGQDWASIVDVFDRHVRSGQTVCVRSSVLPGTCDWFAKRYSVDVLAMPEFLTARIADMDMESQPVICGHGKGEGAKGRAETLAEEIFGKYKRRIHVSNVEAELAKFAHNGNGIVKVAFNNTVYELAKELGASYSAVCRAMLASGYVSPMHTAVPGPDGKVGFGGTCFPPNLDALIELCDGLGVSSDSLRAIRDENKARRPE